MSRRKTSLFDPGILRLAVADAFRKLDPRLMVRNPVMFVVEVVAVLATLALLRAVLTGGTALVHGLPELAGEAFQMHTRIGYPMGVSGLIDVIHDPSFATGVGLVLYGFKTQQKAQRKAERWPPSARWAGSRSSGGFWGRVKKWFREVV